MVKCVEIGRARKNCAYFSAVSGILLFSVFFFLLDHQLDHLKNALL